ncbi:hypothetical protein PR003_g10655 [Phytophthora rubi]|uniref:Uncharacterized protein n=1 Tax=Phytophthora rubi TaxID=129364 RepID=A0A6A4FCW1_9STRA|nr:hypothetical protein PR001_g12918 [Phytophthora rubi]KAE9027482.1 hypothetical protein PR002_g10661 [Phytophthora rubi]KAE9340126.1 hypothetical protein PR003_g10655 [Phytophthora rubi]
MFVSPALLFAYTVSFTTVPLLRSCCPHHRVLHRCRVLRPRRVLHRCRALRLRCVQCIYRHLLRLRRALCVFLFVLLSFWRMTGWWLCATRP